jgi:hypothetical protein
MTEMWSSVATCNVMNQGSQVDNGKCYVSAHYTVFLYEFWAGDRVLFVRLFY